MKIWIGRSKDFCAFRVEYFQLTCLTSRFSGSLNQLYVNGLYHSTVVMAGVLCEQMCYDILAKNSVAVPAEFCFLGLINFLSKNKLVKPDTLIEMKEIWKKRNEYVHLRKKENSDAQNAAIMIEKISKILKNEFALKRVNQS